MPIAQEILNEINSAIEVLSDDRLVLECGGVFLDAPHDTEQALASVKEFNLTQGRLTAAFQALAAVCPDLRAEVQDVEEHAHQAIAAAMEVSWRLAHRGRRPTCAEA